MMRKIVLACVMFVLAASSALCDEYDLAGLWDIAGTGFVEKGILRVSLELDGDMTLTTASTQEILNNAVSRDLVSPDLLSGDLRFLTAYDINLKITATNLDINAWSDHIPNGIKIPAPLPAEAPSEEYPYELPIYVYSEGLTYRMTLTSTTSGKVRITGNIQLDDPVGSIEINSDCAFWKHGTPKPRLEEETSSGCDSGIGAFMLVLIFAGVRKIVWN